MLDISTSTLFMLLTHPRIYIIRAPPTLLQGTGVKLATELFDELQTRFMFAISIARQCQQHLNERSNTGSYLVEMIT